jgi:hypothetical protein
MLAAYMGAEISKDNPQETCYRIKMSGQSFLFDPKKWEFIGIQRPSTIHPNLAEILREVDRLDFAVMQTEGRPKPKKKIKELAMAEAM